MEYRFNLTYTLYSSNLKEPHRSFSPDISLKDFGRGVWRDILKAKKIQYVNPRGITIVLKDKHGVKT